MTRVACTTRVAPTMRAAFLAGGLIAFATACSPAIGDDCSNSSECSSSGDRLCDISQPGGYCTILNCDAGTCPGESLCVEWLGDPSRTARSWCMRTCTTTMDCRNGYRCTLASNVLNSGNMSIATVPESSRQLQKFCVADAQ